ncbi:hypothetical protein EST38_g10476 [Candolleomyces aberdarensis]|uniref:Uncharacterized protein n=1 Tax=Candolleomyces aberdarensis TaxID=2316362 RepID=A0A4V1Q2K2_9AGAR|nr:hypothetical protein EST38_g10476 [Candolleomyces aberdarensis]
MNRAEPRSRSELTQHETLSKGFNILTVAATFTCAIQAQIMGATVGVPKLDQDKALHAINSCFLAGLIFDLMAAVLAFVAARWLQRLTPDEKAFLEQQFTIVENGKVYTHGGTDDEPTLRQAPFPEPYIDADIEPTTLMDNILWILCLVTGVGRNTSVFGGSLFNRNEGEWEGCREEKEDFDLQLEQDAR